MSSSIVTLGPFARFDFNERHFMLCVDGLLFTTSFSFYWYFDAYG